jgi:hypothetical protein
LKAGEAENQLAAQSKKLEAAEQANQWGNPQKLPRELLFESMLENPESDVTVTQEEWRLHLLPGFPLSTFIPFGPQAIGWWCSHSRQVFLPQFLPLSSLETPSQTHLEVSCTNLRHLSSQPGWQSSSTITLAFVSIATIWSWVLIKAVLPLRGHEQHSSIQHWGCQAVGLCLHHNVQCMWSNFQTLVPDLF